MEFYKVAYGGDSDIKMIVATNVYEAVGYYLIEVMNGCGCMDDIVYEEMSPIEKIEVSRIGIPVYKTVLDMHKEHKDNWLTPYILCGLDN